MDRLLNQPAIAALAEYYGRDAVRVQGRRILQDIRQRIELHQLDVATLDGEIDRFAQRLEADLHQRFGPPLARVLNATGIFLHTNLGRSPLAPEIVDALVPLLTAGCDLEFDRDTGQRGDRNRRVGALLAELTGAEAALVVNNNAAAMILVLAVLARGREVIVSRGELVEIGGSFRIPEILAEAGAQLVEVGTTNRTRLADYEAAIGDNTALLLKVYPSNYRIEGFTEETSPAQLAQLAQRRSVPLLVDEGSGLLRPSQRPQLRAHPSLQQLMQQGVDLACGSGDKLAGGPQGGLLVGRRELITACRRHPLYRALRPHRGTLATLELTLRRHLAGAPLPLDSLWPDPHHHRQRLDDFRRSLEHSGVESVELIDADAFLGGGSAPEAPVPGQAIALRGSQKLLHRLRAGSPSVVGYLRQERLILDLRTIAPQDDEALLGAILAAKTAPRAHSSTPSEAQQLVPEAPRAAPEDAAEQVPEGQHLTPSPASTSRP